MHNILLLFPVFKNMKPLNNTVYNFCIYFKLLVSFSLLISVNPTLIHGPVLIYDTVVFYNSTNGRNEKWRSGNSTHGVHYQ